MNLFSKKIPIWIVLLTIIGALLRACAYQYNELPHGDIFLDYAAAVSFLETGRLDLPLITTRPYIEPRYEYGLPLDQHPPLWPVFGGLVARITGDVFSAFKVLSYLIGTLLIPCSYYVFSGIFGKKPAILSSTLITFSYVLIDYSGNGSLYILHAFLYILIILFTSLDQTTKYISLGVISGLLYLLNYQAIVTILAIIAVFLCQFSSRRKQKKWLGFLSITLVFMMLTISPWLARNFILFGNPFFNVNTDYVVSALKVPSEVRLVGTALVKQTLWDQYDFLKMPRLITHWTLKNFIYFIGRIIVLAPVVSFFLPNGMIQLIKNREDVHLDLGLWMTGILMVFHIAISCLWPVFKFRYFVPLLPLVFGLSSYAIFSINQTTKVQNILSLFSVSSLVFVSLVTYLRVPSHTNYYDSNEFFQYRTGETDWLKEERYLIEATTYIKENESDSPIIGPKPSLYYYLNRPIVIINYISDEQIIEFLINEYNVGFIVDKHSRISFYETFIKSSLVFSNLKYSVIMIDR
jgi:hypothetical protein